MKKFIFVLALLPALSSGQMTEKKLLKNKRVTEFAESYQTTPKKTVKFLKCLKTESRTPTYEQLPFFTGIYNRITEQEQTEHNAELWQIIQEECKQRHLF